MRPDDYETARLLGVGYGMGGNAAKAIEYFTKAVELDPDNASALYNLGSAYFNAGDPEKGSAYRQRALELDPELPEKTER